MTFEQFMKAMSDPKVARRLFDEIVQTDTRVWILVEKAAVSEGVAYSTLNRVQIAQEFPDALGFKIGEWGWYDNRVLFRSV